MVLGDWTFDGILTVTSPNDAPAGGSNPTVMLAGESIPQGVGGVPTENTINGKTINGLDVLQVETFIKVLKGSSGSAHAQVFLRYIDSTHYYVVKFISGAPPIVQIRVNNGAGESTIGSNLTAGFADNTWFKARITLWVAAGQAWLLIEEDLLVGEGYVTLGTKMGLGSNLHTGASNKIAIGAGALLANSAVSFDDLKPYTP